MFWNLVVASSTVYCIRMRVDLITLAKRLQAWWVLRWFGNRIVLNWKVVTVLFEKRWGCGNVEMGSSNCGV